MFLPFFGLSSVLFLWILWRQVYPNLFFFCYIMLRVPLKMSCWNLDGLQLQLLTIVIDYLVLIVNILIVDSSLINFISLIESPVTLCLFPNLRLLMLLLIQLLHTINFFLTIIWIYKLLKTIYLLSKLNKSKSVKSLLNSYRTCSS